MKDLTYEQEDYLLEAALERERGDNWRGEYEADFDEDQEDE